MGLPNEPNPFEGGETVRILFRSVCMYHPDRVLREVLKQIPKANLKQKDLDAGVLVSHDLCDQCISEGRTGLEE